MKSPQEIVSSIIINAEGRYTSEQAEEAMVAALQDYERQVMKLEGYLERANWRRCDIAACNCNGYHNWNPTREEIEEPLREELAKMVEALQAERDLTEHAIKQVAHTLGELRVERERADFLEEKVALKEWQGEEKARQLKQVLSDIATYTPPPDEPYDEWAEATAYAHVKLMAQTALEGVDKGKRIG